jgi:cellulose synthase operon protein C
MNRRRPGAALAAVFALIALGACSGKGPDALIASGRDYIARADYSAASIQFRNAVRAQPDNAEARLLLGKSLLMAGDPLGAESELRRALDLGHPRDEVLPLLAQAMLEGGKAEALVRDFGATPPAEVSALARFSASLGDAYAVLQRRDEAVRA